MSETSPAYAAVRYGPIASQGRATCASRHGLRKGSQNLDHCCPQRRGLVLAMGPKTDAKGVPLNPFDVGACLDAETLRIKAKRRQKAAIGSEFLFIASDRFFERREAPASPQEGTGQVGDSTDDEEASEVEGKATPLPEIDCQDLKDGLARTLRAKDWHGRFLPNAAERTAAGMADDKKNEPVLQKGDLIDRWQEAWDAGDEETRAWLDRFDPDRVVAWVATIVDAIEVHPHFHLASLRLDLDEKTPHASAFIVPTYMKRLKQSKTKGVREELWVSNRQNFNTKAQLRALQDWVGKVCGPLGLVRGRPRSETCARNVDPVTYHEWEAKLRSADANLAAARGEIERAAALTLEAEEIMAKAGGMMAEAKQLGDTNARRSAQLEEERVALEAREAQLERDEAENTARIKAKTMEQAKAEEVLEAREQTVARRESAVEERDCQLRTMLEPTLTAANVARIVLSAVDDRDEEVEAALAALNAVVPPDGQATPNEALAMAVIASRPAEGMSHGM